MQFRFKSLSRDRILHDLRVRLSPIIHNMNWIID